MIAVLEENDAVHDDVGNIVDLRARACVTGGDAASSKKANLEGRPLRFFTSLRTEVNTFRISALFEAEPELDGVVCTMIRNGYRYIADLHAARLQDVFAQAELRLDKRRLVIERLLRDAEVRLVS